MRGATASGPLIAIVDAGPLYAAVDADDQDHERLGMDLAISLDRRHMRAVRLKDGRSLRVIPE